MRPRLLRDSNCHELTGIRENVDGSSTSGLISLPLFRNSVGKISVNSHQGRLFLSGAFPRRDGQPGTYRTRLPLKRYDTPADRKAAEKSRAYVQRQIDAGTFCWDDFVDNDSKLPIWRDGINALYRKRVVMGRTSEDTWEINYMGRLRQAPLTKPITAKSVEEFISKWKRDTCSYKEVYYLLIDLCGLVNVTFPEVPIPTYSGGRLKEVPEDSEIIDCISQLDGRYQWTLGMMAVYGMRPHEIAGCKFYDDDRHRLQVPDETKTGYRAVIPCPADWVDLFNLRDERRYLGKDLGRWMYDRRKAAGIPWTAYALRHAYAGRLWRYGGSTLDIYTAARLMGHSVKEHARTYRQFIDPIQIAEKAEEALRKNLSKVASKVEEQFGSSAVPRSLD